ncbi:hypothetical protein Salat_2736600 [Sesamum alatum]|uniref:Uncharacterized protein n=1 Tax=Sesamum alatum TaxID=300844 RepID=A0AAE2C920_9LAMI|nr:hypothetical protein Salat_2736600 [Sesamum alatum]
MSNAQIAEKMDKLQCCQVENEVIRSSTLQDYARGRDEGASSAISAFKNSLKCTADMCRNGTSFYIHGFATCLEQSRNLGQLPPNYDYSFVNVRADEMGHINRPGPSNPPSN